MTEAADHHSLTSALTPVYFRLAIGQVGQVVQVGHRPGGANGYLGYLSPRIATAENWNMKRWLPTVLLAALVGIFAMFTTMVFAQQEQSGTRKVISRSSPIYPDLARRMQMSGTVRVEVVVAPSGTVKSTKAMGGSPLLLKAATDAIAKWKWSSSPQESTELIELNFHP